MTPAGIEPATLRFVVQHLNHCATAAPRPLMSFYIINWLYIVIEGSFPGLIRPRVEAGLSFPSNVRPRSVDPVPPLVPRDNQPYLYVKPTGFVKN